MVFVLLSDDMNESMSYEQRYHEGIPLVSKLKKDQLIEAVGRMEALGWTEGHVWNVSKSVWSNGKEVYYRQTSWYVYKEEGQWYYKQSKKTKAFHKVEGVE